MSAIFKYLKVYHCWRKTKMSFCIELRFGIKVACNSRFTVLIWNFILRCAHVLRSRQTKGDMQWQGSQKEKKGFRTCAYQYCFLGGYVTLLHNPNANRVKFLPESFILLYFNFEH